MTSSTLPSRAWCLAGVAMVISLRIGVCAFRSFNVARSGGRQRLLGSARPSSTDADQGPDLANLRENYVSAGIDENSLPREPHELMAKWIEDACQSKEVIEPNAMCLCTVGEEGRPSARFVLMKGFDERGVTWYTNYNSRKSKELKKYPYAAVTFWWGALHRSIRLEGDVAMVSDEESNTYFNCRPLGSKIGAWVSDQSEPIGSRQELDAKAKKIEESLVAEGENVLRPPHWGGFRLRPTRVEFWEGQPSRLHDRFVYSQGDGADGGEKWTITRLQP
ncbi:unnamed protein product [Ascophyllum nodosum]